MPATPATALEGKIRVAEGRCPNGHLLMSSEKRFDGQNGISALVRHNGREGVIYLNPFYGRFEFKSDLTLKRGDVLSFCCPSCQISLAVDTLCRMCNIQMFAIHLADGGQVEACPTIGCHNHSLKVVNLDEQLARMYLDETKVQM